MFKVDCVFRLRDNGCCKKKSAGSVITKHLKKVFDSGELNKEVVWANFAHTTQHGAIQGKTQNRLFRYYNLRAVTAVGYRINMHRATEFRKWAGEILHGCITKGFTVDDELKPTLRNFTWV